jgi:hypothetical protein
MKVEGGEALVLKVGKIAESVEALTFKQVTTIVDYLKSEVIRKVSGGILQRRSGRLADSIRGEVILGNGVVTGRVYSDGTVPYFGIQERGGTTRPHDIVPRNASALRFAMFTSRGKRSVTDVWFATRVHHPGSRIPAHHFLLDTLREFRQLRDEIIAKRQS